MPDQARPAISRRHFVQSAVGSAAAISLVPAALAPAAGLPISRSAHAAGSDTLKIGLIGCGGRGTGAASQALRADPGAKLTAMGDMFADRIGPSFDGLSEDLGEDAKAKIDVPADRKFVGPDSYKEVLASNVDVVILTAYPAFRPEHLRAAIDAGKHVFAEKPVAVDAPGLRSVYESGREAERRNLALMVGFCWRHNDGMMATFDKVNSGVIGDVTSVHTTYHGGTLGRRPRQPAWSDMEFQLRNWWHFTWLSGDHIVEQAIHSVDRMAWALGDILPTKVTCLGGRAARSGPEHGNVYDHFAAVYEYEGGRRAFHTCRQMDDCPGDNTDYIYGTRGQCTVNGWTPTYLAQDYRGAKLWQYDGPNDRDMYQNEHDTLFKSIRDGKPVNDAERSCNSNLMALMGRMAAYTGQTITWDQAMNSQENLVPAELKMGPAETPPVAIPGKTKFI
jgi:myo-inositol 2-dehydrogenase/D-chiro-inositol 1-dehydrogenase